MEYIPAKTILSARAKNNGWFGADFNMNLYKGCCHGCIYCDSRSECYGVERFDTVRAKENALTILERELKSKRGTGVVGTGAMSDPYNLFERTLGLTGGALALLERYGFGLCLATKSDLVLRDAPILERMARKTPVLIKFTVTCADDRLATLLEPHVSLPSERFAAIRALSGRGIFTGILMMPVLPFIEDTPENVTDIVRKAAEAGARFIYPAFGVTLRQNQRDWFYLKLDALFPGVKQQYIERFGNAYECRSPAAGRLWTVFKKECDARGILYAMDDIVAAYKTPYETPQLTLF